MLSALIYTQGTVIRDRAVVSGGGGASFPRVPQSYRVVSNAAAVASGALDRGCREEQGCSQCEQLHLDVPELCGEENHQRCCLDLQRWNQIPDKRRRLDDLTEM